MSRTLRQIDQKVAPSFQIVLDGCGECYRVRLHRGEVGHEIFCEICDHFCGSAEVGRAVNGSDWKRQVKTNELGTLGEPLRNK